MEAFYIKKWFRIIKILHQSLSTNPYAVLIKNQWYISTDMLPTSLIFNKKYGRASWIRQL